MIRSMTAFSRAEKTVGPLTVAVEIRCFNSRNLDMAVRTPQRYPALEEKIKALLGEQRTRGRIEVSLQVCDASEAEAAFEIDESRTSAYVSALTQLKNRFGLASEISLDHLVHLPGLIKPRDMEADLETVWSVLFLCLSGALADIEAMRQREGQFLARDLSRRMDEIEGVIQKIERESDGLIAHYQERLKERIGVLTNGLVEIDPGRIAQEAAFMADRSDISEEIVRAKSHISHFRSLMDADEPAGRKLNFLLQEFNREFNTMGSKTGSTQISHHVVWMKSELEKIREQIQNVE